MISNTFSKVVFWPQVVDKKRSGDGGCFIDRSRGGRAIFFDEDALFIFRFYSINLQCLGIGVCKENQGRADIEKADIADGADKVDCADRADKNKADRADGANKDGANRTDRANKGGIDKEELDGADRSEVDAEEPDRADGADKGGVDVEKLDRVRTNRGGADVEKPDGPGIAAEDLSLGDLRLKRQRVATQVAIWLSFFFFLNIVFLFFSSSKLETYDSSFFSSPSSSVDNVIK